MAKQPTDLGMMLNKSDERQIAFAAGFWNQSLLGFHGMLPNWTAGPEILMGQIGLGRCGWYPAQLFLPPTASNPPVSAKTQCSPPERARVPFRSFTPLSNGKKQRVCENAGCQLFAMKYGLYCKKHGGIVNGATGFCRTPDCSVYAHAHGYCRKHSKIGVCSVADCNCYAHIKGLCRKHGGKTICKINVCTSCVLVKGLCAMHSNLTSVVPLADAGRPSSTPLDPVVAECSKKKCTAFAVVRGRCSQHNPKNGCAGDQGKCPNKAVRKGVCVKHGARGRCLKSSCTAFAIARRLCRNHGANGFCTTEGCTTIAAVKGLCAKHRDLKKTLDVVIAWDDPHNKWT